MSPKRSLGSSEFWLASGQPGGGRMLGPREEQRVVRNSGIRHASYSWLGGQTQFWKSCNLRTASIKPHAWSCHCLAITCFARCQEAPSTLRTRISSGRLFPRVTPTAGVTAAHGYSLRPFPEPKAQHATVTVPCVGKASERSHRRAAALRGAAAESARLPDQAFFIGSLCFE